VSRGGRLKGNRKCSRILPVREVPAEEKESCYSRGTIGKRRSGSLRGGKGDETLGAGAGNLVRVEGSRTVGAGVASWLKEVMSEPITDE